MARTERYRADVGHVEGARPYGVGGVVPADAVVTNYSPHATRDAKRYTASDAPFVQPYNERPTCSGTRSDTKPCNAKAEPGESYCKAHNKGA